jgi:hypothetical protein
VGVRFSTVPSATLPRALLFASLLAGVSASGQVVADLRGDFDTPTTAHTDGQTSAGHIPDSVGTGVWNFLRSDLGDPTAAGANLTFLTYTTTSSGNGVRASNAYVSIDGSYDLPAWSNTVLINPGASEGSPAANELEVHPGSSTFAVASWTSGYTGLVNLAGSFHDIGTVGNGLTLEIYLNGSALFSTTTSGLAAASFDQTFSVTSSDSVYFVIGNNGNFGGDSSALSATITAVPEPSTYAAFLGLGALGSVAFRRRRVPAA